MADASGESSTQSRNTRRELIKRIYRLIHDNSLDEIKEIFENLQPRHCIKILNSTMSGCLPLYIAVNLNRVKISRYLIKISLLQGRREMLKRWKKHGHPLIAAIDVGNRKMIKKILKHLPDINDNLSGPLSPLMVAIFLGNLNSVKVIVAKGADVNRPCLHGRIPLMYSTSSGEICSFLLSHGASVNHKDCDGFTALHLAAVWDHTDSVNHLINAGADIKIRNHEGMNPLIWATINLNMPMITELANNPVYFEIDKIHSLEILNACLVCDQKPDTAVWAGTLMMRNSKNLPKNCQIPAQEILDNSVEFTTEEELENLGEDPLRLAYQGILVVERILGRKNRLYMQFLLQTALIAKQENNTEKVKQLIDHVQEFCEEPTFVAANLYDFKNIFYVIAQYSDPNSFFEDGGFAIFKIISQAVVKMWRRVKNYIHTYPSFVDNYYLDIVDTFLYMTSTTESLITSLLYLGQLREEVKRVVEDDLRVRHHQSILHRAIVLSEDEPWASVELIRVLLESGADVNSKDGFGRGIVTYALQHVPEHNRIDVLELIDEYGDL